MNCVILQPSYIPWRGVFDQIRRADVFVFYDDVQYDKRGWRNRNQIKTPNGKRWLTIPVNARGAQIDGLPINAIPISWERDWRAEHLNALRHAYAQAPYFRDYDGLLSELYSRKDELLADLTIEVTVMLARRLGITHTQFLRSSSLEVQGAKTARLIGVLRRLGATHYITGPAARSYIEEDLFREAGISIEYMRYEYRDYPQLHPPYDPQVSVLDLMFMTGPAALGYITERAP
jgi:hypothetical protein